jgi:predicted anti-sigma-YlaC factor YlaD
MSELVTDYLERATPLGLRFDMWWHLVRCPACRNYYDQMRKTVQLLRRPVATPPSPAAEQAMLDAARGRSQRDA